MQRKFNPLLLLFSLLGGGIGFILGEVALHQLLDTWPRIIVIGLYFGIVALSIGLACLLAELITPKLNGLSWKQRYSDVSWKWLVPATLVLLFGAGTLLEWGHQFNPSGSRQVRDIVLVIDNSGSMMVTDPDRQRLQAAKNLVEQMDRRNRVGVILFNVDATILQPLTEVGTDAQKQAVNTKLDEITDTMEGTDIGLALSETLLHIQEQGDADGGTMVILLSDGDSAVDVPNVLAPYVERGIAVNTVGLALTEPSGVALLQNIAQTTGGTYTDVARADTLSAVFSEIFERSVGDRTLVTERSGQMGESTFLAIYRVAALAIVGVVLGLALGLVFDNRFLARNFAIGGGLGGVLAGLVLEQGLSGSAIGDPLIRLMAMLLLSGILALFMFVLPVSESTRRNSGHAPGRRTGRGEEEDRPARSRRNRGF